MEYKYIDIHTHMNLDAFQDDWKEVVDRTLTDGVAEINVGTNIDSSKRAVELSELFEDGVYATVGIHPTEASKPEVTFDTEEFKVLAQHPKVVAIGECGFDYFRVDKDTKEKQEKIFIEQIALANEIGKPLMLHVRPSTGTMDAYEDALWIVKEHAKVLGNVHFFAGTLEIAQKFWEIGFTTSFTGVITFADQYDDVIKNTPLEMLHAETDAPYVAPKPYRGERNEPLHVREVYKRIAELRGEGEEKVRAQLMENAKKLFEI